MFKKTGRYANLSNVESGQSDVLVKEPTSPNTDHAKTKSEMGPLTKVLNEWTQAYFKKSDLEISDDSNHATYKFNCEDKGDFSYEGLVEVYEAHYRIDVYLDAPIHVPNNKLSEVAALVARINHSLISGAIGIDMDSGKVGFKANADIQGGILSVDMINNLVDKGMAILDHYLPSVMSVAYANVNAKDAYDLVEGNKQDLNRIGLLSPDETEPFPWEQFEGSDKLHAWSDEIRDAIESQVSEEKWSLVGRSAILINDDVNYGADVLRRVAKDAGLQYVVVDDYDVMKISFDDFRSMAPVLVYLVPGRWLMENAPDQECQEDAEAVKIFRDAFKTSLRKFNPGKAVIFVTLTDNLDDVALELKQVGVFEKFLSIPMQSLEMVGKRFIDSLGMDLCGNSMTGSLGKVGRLVSVNCSTSEVKDLTILEMKRFHSKQKRKLEFVDLVDITTHSLVEEGLLQPRSEETRKQTAYHEAGHAIIAILESGGKDVPDYTSILPGASGFGGVTVESYEYLYITNDDQLTYADFRRDIRVTLAGRAAEEVYAGIERVSNGASSDLEYASRKCWRAFKKWGFSPSMGETGQSESNLAIVYGEPTPSEYAHVENLTRDFLAKEYRVVRDKLISNRALLDDVAGCLMKDPIVDQKEIAEICIRQGVEVTLK